MPRTGAASRATSPSSDQLVTGQGTFRTIGSLAVVLGIAVAAGAAMRVIARKGGIGGSGRSPSGVLEVLGRYPVGRGASLTLLKLDRRILLVSQSSGGRLGSGAGMTTLCEVTDPDEVASILLKSRDAEGDSLSERFRSLLSRFDRTMDSSVVDVPARGRTWEESPATIPVVDLTVRSGDSGSSGPVGALRRRLAAFMKPGGDRA